MTQQTPPQPKTPPSAENDFLEDTEDFEGLTFEVVEQEEQDGKIVASRGVYLFPNAITTLALLSGFYSILASSNGDFFKAGLAIYASAILDGMDGRVARLLNAQSPFGEQYDSLADMLSFGIAPAMLAYHFALEPLGRVGLAAAFIFSACAAFRLARFNVQIGVVDKKFFVGLASPLGAFLIVSAVMVALDRSELIDIQSLPIQIIAMVWTVVAGLLMVSNLKYYSFKDMDKRRVPFITLIVTIFVLGMVLYDIPLGLLGIGLIYALSGIFVSWKYRQSR